MSDNLLMNKLKTRDINIRLEKLLDNSKADSGGTRDLNFLKFLLDQGILLQYEAVLKRTNIGTNEEYFLDRYKKMSYESDRHFLCRTIIQDELKKLGIDTLGGVSAGNMSVLHSDGNYDIITSDFKNIIDVGLAPARNYFRGLTDLKFENYLITSFFDDYMDDIIFSIIRRADDVLFINSIKDYEEGYKIYVPNADLQSDDVMFYNQPSLD